MPAPCRFAAHRAAALVLLLAMSWSGSVRADASEQRVVSLNPSLTAILLALEAGDRLVGADAFSLRQQPELAGLPAVGGLFNPSLEAVVALRPDLVVLVPSVEQRDFRTRLEALGTRVVAFPNQRFEEVLENIERLGALVDREPRAAARVAAIRRTRREVERATAEREPVRSLVVLQRDPIFVVGGGNFIDEMLHAVGAHNLAGEFAEPYPRVAAEWLVERAPDVLIDMSLDAQEPGAFWQRWPTLPAVRAGRVLRVDPELLTMPGPALDRSLLVLARALHGDALVERIEAALAAPPAAGSEPAP